MRVEHAKTGAELNAALAANERVAVDFYKDNCPGCKMLDVALKQVDAPGVLLLKVRLEDVGEGLFRSLGLRQTPTLALHLRGTRVALLPGFTPAAQLRAHIRACL